MFSKFSKFIDFIGHEAISITTWLFNLENKIKHNNQ